MVRHPGQHNDGESLQADVMRFMAIIAFCLIAILALVRNVEPTSSEQTPTQAAKPVAGEEPKPKQQQTPRPVPKPLPTKRPKPVVASRSPDTFTTSRAEPTPVPPLPEPDTEPMASAEPAVAAEPAAAAESAVEPTFSAEPTVAAEPMVTSAPNLTAERTPDADTLTAVDEQPGLSLRFASEKDFLRLVTKGDIEVFAFKPGDVLALGPAFRFEPSPRPPGQVYELLPETIPELMAGALRDQRPNLETYAWGIRMPKAMASQIQRFLDQDAVGELVINRYGEVIHVADA